MPDEDRLPEIQVLFIGTIEELSDAIQPRNPQFTLFLAWDALALDQAQLRKWMQPLVDRGLVYFCAWGRECKALHDAVDMCDIEPQKNSGNPDFFIMTTWHDDEPLEEALWFFQTLALPTEPPIVGNFDRFAVAVGNPQWADEMSRFFLASKAV
jgi:hypothetical protein